MSINKIEITYYKLKGKNRGDMNKSDEPNYFTKCNSPFVIDVYIGDRSEANVGKVVYDTKERIWSWAWLDSKTYLYQDGKHKYRTNFKAIKALIKKDKYERKKQEKLYENRRKYMNKSLELPGSDELNYYDKCNFPFVITVYTAHKSWLHAYDVGEVIYDTEARTWFWSWLDRETDIHQDGKHKYRTSSKAIKALIKKDLREIKKQEKQA